MRGTMDYCMYPIYTYKHICERDAWLLLLILYVSNNYFSSDEQMEKCMKNTIDEPLGRLLSYFFFFYLSIFFVFFLFDRSMWEEMKKTNGHYMNLTIKSRQVNIELVLTVRFGQYVLNKQSSDLLFFHPRAKCRP